MTSFWRNPAESPEMIFDSSSENETRNSKDTTHSDDDLEKIRDSVEEVRADSPVMGQGSVQNVEQVPTKTSRVECVQLDSTDDSPIRIFNKKSASRSRPQQILSDSEEEDEIHASASSGGLEGTVQDVTLQFDNFAVAVSNHPTSTPMASTKTFSFKARTVEQQAKLSPSVLHEEETDPRTDRDLDLSKSFQLLDISPPSAIPASQNFKTNVEARLDPEEATNVEQGAVEGPHVLPAKVQPTAPARPLKTIFLDDLPQTRPVGSTTNKVFIPTSDYNQVDRALTQLSKSIELIPPVEDEAPTPAGFKTKLYPHQGYGLQWLWWREHHFPGGGILADEMGLGKTVMIMALVMKSIAEGSPSFEKKKENDWHSNDKERLPSQCTLIVVPPSVIGQWELEIAQKTSGLRHYVFHGANREKSPKLLSRYDIILSTYSTVASEIPKQDGRHTHYYAGNSPLVNIGFERIVLDEGHSIRNDKTNVAQAVCQIKAKHRWVVTGTPIHNRPSDMYSLVKFLRLTPFDDAKLWDHWIGLKKISETAHSQARLNIIGRALVLRRTKAEVIARGDGCPTIPPKTLEDIELELSEGEQEIYDHLEAYAASVCKKFLKEHEEKKLMRQKQIAADKYISNAAKPKSNEEVSFTTVFTFILRLRQCCVLPYLIHSMVAPDDIDGDVDADSSDLPEDDEIISLRNPVFSPQYVSTKIARLLVDLKTIRDRASEENRKMEKVVVVSQWKSFLDLMKVHLAQEGYRTCEITGDTKISDRAGITLQFNGSSRKPEVMLLSLAAGGVGLNLIGANHMFFMDLHWNPQLELQAQDRIHRFGQTKEVKIYRYIIKQTMEERVLKLQQEKLNLANGLLSNQKVGPGLSIHEMRKLFGL